MSSAELSTDDIITYLQAEMDKISFRGFKTMTCLTLRLVSKISLFCKIALSLLNFLNAMTYLHQIS